MGPTAVVVTAWRCWRRLSPQGRLIVIDRDPHALEAAHELAQRDTRVTVVKGSFGEIERIAADQAILGKVDGIVLDLGVSSPQLDDAERGFSFLRDGPLDMRMDPESGLSAADWINSATEADMARVMLRLGEERAARRIARAIVNARTIQKIERTGQLANIIEAVLPRRGKGKHPATKTFQAIRIYINNELGELQAFLKVVLKVLAPGGRLCVISFHSLEDRLVKRFLRDHSRVDPALASLASCPGRSAASNATDRQGCACISGRNRYQSPCPKCGIAHRGTSGMNAQLRQIGWISLLALAVVVTAIACVYARHESRKQFTHLQSLIADRDNLEVEWGKLKIEQSTWSTHGRVEQLAREKMQMLNPVQKDVTVVLE